MCLLIGGPGRSGVVGLPNHDNVGHTKELGVGSEAEVLLARPYR